MNSRERVLSLLEKQPVDHLALMPITMMFAARHIAARYGGYALDHRIMTDAQIRTSRDFDFDHVSGITETREAPDCGAPIRCFDDQPYAIDESEARLTEKSRLEDLKCPDPLAGEHMLDRIRGLALLKQKVGGEKIIEGWVEGPCGAAADLRGINRLMVDFYDDPLFIRNLFEFVLQLALRFGKAQADAGADLIGIGDPAASLVGPQIYEEYVWPCEKRLADGLHAAGVRARLHICGNTSRILEGMGRLGCDIVDIDSAVPLWEARRKMGPEQILLGGIDPVRILQNGSQEDVAAAVAECHRQAGPRYIVGAGCEVPRDTPVENIRELGRYARTH
ncbi:MAG TPA: uroporphyrinogen decarboxylase family protein [Acidobacteriota bacterium]|nr:uroporphyrinogen decarboxylase family protein [Acidobacteriota bacterium]